MQERRDMRTRFDDIGDPVFLGFEPRTVMKGAEWLPDHVKEICTVTECNVEQPVGLKAIEEWYNLGFVSSESTAWKAVDLYAPKEEEDQLPYEILAYRLYPVMLDTEGAHVGFPPELEECFPKKVGDLSGFVMIGYDVSDLTPYGKDYCRGCSPLSCNSMAEEIPVNRYCLIDELERAFEVGEYFGKEQPEPGCYWIFEVWRKREHVHEN